MRRGLILGVVLAVITTACGPSVDGRVALEVAVSGLAATQHFCFTYQLFQRAEGSEQWLLVDEETAPRCGAAGIDTASSVATCYAGQRFLVAYDVTFLEGTRVLGHAQGASGGGASDVCVRNHDTPNHALFQFGNEGPVGGINPGLTVDQVCSNDKNQLEDGRVVSALWMLSDDCGGSGPPGSYCALGRGAGLSTLRFGTTEDGKVRHVFSDSAPDAVWDLHYLAFAPTLPVGEVTLQHHPWVLHHWNLGAGPGRALETSAVLSYRMESVVGFVQLAGDRLEVLHERAASCDGAVVLGAQHEVVPLPSCQVGPFFRGALPAGGARFDLVFDCDGTLRFLPCDASSAGAVCGGQVT